MTINFITIIGLEYKKNIRGKNNNNNKKKIVHNNEMNV